MRTGSDDGPTIAERTHTPDPAAVERLKRLMAEQAAERERQRQDDTAARARAGLRARLLARAKAAREADGETAARAEAPASPKRRPGQEVRQKPPPRLTEDAVRALHARNLAGETLKTLAAEVGLHSCTLSDYLKRYGLHGQRRKLHVTDAEAAAAFADHAAGKSWQKIADAMGISSKALRLLRRQSGQAALGGARLNSSARRFDDDHVHTLYARYTAGESLAVLGAELRADPTTLRRRFQALGLSLDVRPPGPAPFTLTPEQVAAVLTDREAGKTWDAIAAGVGCGRKTLALALNRVGLSTAEYSGKPASAMDEAAVVAAAVAAHEAGKPWDVVAAEMKWRRQNLVMAVRRAGYSTGNRRPRPKASLTEEDWSGIVAEREAGMTLEEIAARHGVDRRALSLYLRRHGYVVKRVVKPVIEVDEGLVRSLHARHMVGEHIRALAEENGLHFATLTRRFRRLGLAQVGGARPHWFPDEQIEAAVAAHAAGKTWKVIAAEHGVTQPTLCKAVRRAGYETSRPPGK